MKKSSFSIRKRLALGFFSITFTTVILGLFSIYIFKEETKFVKKMFMHPYTVSNAVKNIHAKTMSMHTSMHQLMIGDSSTIFDDEIAKINQMDQIIKNDFKILSQRYLGPKEDVDKAYSKYIAATVLRDKLIKLLEKGDVTEAESIMVTAGKIHITELTEKILILSNYADNKAKEFYTLAREKEEIAISSLVLFLIFVSLASIFIAITTINAVTKPLDTLLSISDNINKGVFKLPESNDIQNLKSRSDELGQVFNSYNQILTYLLQPYGKIIKSNRSLVEITAEIGRLLDSFDENVIASKTDPSGRIVYASKAFQNISGFSKEELIGKNQNIVRHPDMQEDLFKDLWKTIKSGKTWHGEIKNKKKDGSSFWIDTNISPDIDRNGKIIGFNAINTEISVLKAYEELSDTLEKRVEDEINKNNEKTQYLIQQSRLAQMGEMISMIAHQWRQPLSSISAVSGTLLLDIELDNYNDKFFKDRLTSISELSQHLSSTIDDFRGFFKDNKEKELSDIQSVIEDAISIIHDTLKNKGINIKLEFIDNPDIQTHLNEIKQVILNIVKNAEDALLEHQIEEAKILLKVYTENEYVCVMIKDNGGGIPEDIINKIFDPYFSTKKSKDGTGLGLYMSKTIIEEHCNGILDLKSNDEGTAFFIKIPTYQIEQET